MSKTRFRVAAKAIILDETQTKLLMLFDTYLWNLPGGGIEACEQALDCLPRELAEEIGVTQATIDPRPVGVITYPALEGFRGSIDFIEVYYRADIGRQTPVLGEAKLKEWRYFTSDELRAEPHGPRQPWFELFCDFLRDEIKI
jgi:8-oxo-dGTP pyrophosphatase MutT (NUDIX family)